MLYGLAPQCRQPCNAQACNAEARGFTLFTGHACHAACRNGRPVLGGYTTAGRNVQQQGKPRTKFFGRHRHETQILVSGRDEW